jgi:hypothetical protein
MLKGGQMVLSLFLLLFLVESRKQIGDLMEIMQDIMFLPEDVPNQNQLSRIEHLDHRDLFFQNQNQ